MKIKTSCFFVIFVFLPLLINDALAQWSNDPTVNTPICTATDKQTNPYIVSDGAGGAIITWLDYRNGSTSDIYAQRIDASGVLQWTANGVAICTAANDQDYAQLVSDGAGGAIITWRDLRGPTSDIFAQRINSEGVVQWTVNGIYICTDLGYQSPPVISSDNANGAIIAWEDERDRIGVGDIYCQRINTAGVVQWTTNGVVICADTSSQGKLIITSDGANGAIVAWGDLRNGSQNNDIYSQRISGAGVVQWTTNGVVICTAPDEQTPTSITSDGANGAIIVWSDRRIGGIVNYDIYSQRINAAGVVQWTSNGVAICTAPNGQNRIPFITSDGNNGAIIVWSDKRSAYYNGNIYCQRINATGTVQWTTDGVAICTDSSEQNAPVVTSDGVNGAIFAWRDFRNGSNHYDIYGQRINVAGNVSWTTDGVVIRTLPSVSYLLDITSDGANGAILAFQDHRNGGLLINADIYGQRVRMDGSLGNPTNIDDIKSAPIEFSLQQNYPNPFNPSTSIQYAIGSMQFVQLKVYDILGYEIATLVNEEKYRGVYTVNFNASNLASGMYLYKLQAGSFVETKKMVLMK